MNYLNLPWIGPVSVFDICQAHKQLESDYNVGGWLPERPSNLRRMEATACQLHRMAYSDPRRWVDICTDPDEDFSGDKDDDDDDAYVRDIYLLNVLKLNLPISEDMRDFIERRYSKEFLTNNFPNWSKK